MQIIIKNIFLIKIGILALSGFILSREVHWMELKNKFKVSMVYCCKSSHRGCSVEKVFLKISQILQETPVLKSLLNNFNKKRLSFK